MPLPGRMALVIAMRPRVIQPMGLNATSRRDDRSGPQGGSLGVLHRPGLGRQLGHHEDDHDLERGGDDHAERAEGVSRHHADQGRRHQGAQLAGRTARPAAPGRCARPGGAGCGRRCRFSSTNERALTLEVRVRAVSDMARKPVAHDQHHDDDEEDDVLGGEVVADAAADGGS